MKNQIPKLIPKLIPKPGRAVCIGVKPIKPMFFMDFDKEYWDFGKDVARHALVIFGNTSHNYNNNPQANHFQIFQSKGGYHMIQIMPTWKYAREKLHEFIKKFKVKYESNPHETRLRVSPKWRYEDGKIMNRAPKLLFSCINDIGDLRFSDRTRREYYFTLKM